MAKDKKKEKIYFTIAGMQHYYGMDFVKKNMEVKLVMEPDNEYDSESIRVEFEGLGKAGYVANSPYTVLGESLSAGRLYDRIGKKAKGRVKMILPKGVLCVID